MSARDTTKDGNNTLTYVLPDVIDPPEYVCVTLRIPKNKFHIMAFKGALWDLCNWWNWEKDDAHTATLVAQVWRKVFKSLRFEDCVTKQTDFIEAEIAMAIHVDCDCNVTVDCCDGTTKQLATTDMINQPGQPGGGSPQPQPGGGCQSYSLSLTPSTMATAPTTVNAGDTVQVLNIAGSWNDGSGFTGWYCPDGLKFFADCVPGSSVLNGGDPLPGSPYMQIVGVLNGTTYFNPFVVYTIPGGVVGGRVEFQANRPALTSAWGDITFDAKICNNATPPVANWCRFYDFTADAYALLVGGDFSYVGATGYETTPDATFHTLTMLFGATLTITDWTVIQDNVGSNSNPLGLWHTDGSVVDPGLSGSTVGTLTTWHWTGAPVALVKGMQWTAHGVLGTPSTLKSVMIKGQGTPPTTGTAC